MNEEEIQNMVKNVRALLEAFYALSFANPLIVAISQLEGRHILPAEEAYPEIFNDPKVRPYFNLFLSGNERGYLKLTPLGKVLREFGEHIHDLLSNDDLIARVNQVFGLELSNPVRDFVYSAVSATDKVGKICLRTAASLDNPYYMEEPYGIEKIKEKFDIEISKEQVREKAKELNGLLLSEKSSYIRIPELFKPYILEATSELKGEERK